MSHLSMQIFYILFIKRDNSRSQSYYKLYIVYSNEQNLCETMRHDKDNSFFSQSNEMISYYSFTCIIWIIIKNESVENSPLCLCIRLRQYTFNHSHKDIVRVGLSSISSLFAFELAQKVFTIWMFQFQLFIIPSAFI